MVQVGQERGGPSRWTGLGASGFAGVLGQTGILLHHCQGGGVNFGVGGAGRGEDVAEVLVGHLGKVSTVFRLHAQGHGVGGQGFAFTLGHVFGQLVHDRAQYQHRLAAVGQGAFGGAAVGAGGHAEGGVARGAVGDGGNKVRTEAALAFEQHVAPAAARATRGFGKGGSGGEGEQGTDQNPFHG